MSDDSLLNDITNKEVFEDPETGETSTVVDNDDSRTTFNQPQIEQTPSNIQQEDDSSIVQVINESNPNSEYNLRRFNEIEKRERRVRIIKFLKEYSRNINRDYQTVATHLGLAEKTGYKYLKEFIDVVISAADQDRFPNAVATYFNDLSIPKDERLVIGDIQILLPVVKRYSDYNTDAIRNDGTTDYDLEQQHEKDLISNEDNINVSIMSNTTTSLPPTQQSQQAPFKKIQTIFDPDDVDEIHPNSHTITQLINFGLKKFPDIPQHHRKQIMDLLRTNRVYYATNHMALRDILSSVVKHQPTVNSFLNWLEGICPIYLLPGEPFYAGNNAIMGGGAGNQGFNPMMMQNPQQQQIQQMFPNLTPFQQMQILQNMQQNRQMSAEEKALKEDESIDRAINRYVKLMTMKMLNQSAEQSPQGGGQGGSGAMGMDLMTMIASGAIIPRETVGPDGTRSMQYMPAWMMQQQQQGQGNALNSVDGVLSLVKTIMEMSGNKGNSLTEEITKMMVGKMMSDPVEQIVKLKEMGDKLGFGAGAGNKSGLSEAEAMRLRLEMQRMDNEKEFGMKQLEMQREAQIREETREARHEQQSNENINMLMQFVPSVIQNMAGPIIKKFIGGGSAPAPAAAGPMMMPNGYMPPNNQPPQQPNIMEQLLGGNDRNLQKITSGAVGGVISADEPMIDPRVSQYNTMEEQQRIENERRLREQIEQEVLHKVNVHNLRNSVEQSQPQEDDLATVDIKSRLKTLPYDKLVEYGERLRASKQQWDETEAAYNEILSQYNEQQQEQPVVQQQSPQMSYPFLQEQEKKDGFEIPEGVDLNSDGLEGMEAGEENVISEEEYEKQAK